MPPINQRLKTFFISLLLLEFAAFILVANWLGFFNSLLLLCLSSFVGVALFKRARLNLPKQWPQGSGQLPPGMMRPGLLLAIILIVLPGFITDLIGLLLLLPFVRAGLAKSGWLTKLNPFTGQPPGAKPPHRQAANQSSNKNKSVDGQIIEGQCEHISKKQSEHHKHEPKK